MDLLAICGGGVWGIGVLWVLKTLESLGFVVRHRFEAYAGTSTGAIITALLAYGYSPTQAYTIMKMEIGTVFTKHSVWARWFSLSSARYDNKAFAKVLDKHIKPGTRMCDLPRDLYLVSWRNNGIDRNKVFGPKDETLVKDAVMASAAAPWYFDFVEVANDELSDGGLWQNNPAMVLLVNALYEMKFGKNPVDLENVRICTFITSGNSEGRRLKGKNWVIVFKEILSQLLSGRASGTDFMVQKLSAIIGGSNITLMPELSDKEQDIPLDGVSDVDKIEEVWKRCYSKNKAALISWFSR